jgi:predicted N-acyltransferase
MEESGASCTIQAPPFADLDRVASLCHETASRHGTGFYYPPDRLAAFLHGCGSCVRCIRIDLRGELLGVFVCFAAQECLHLWAAGTRYDLSQFSPYEMIFLAAVRHGIEHRIPLIEGGRGNGSKKLKLGFKPLRLFAFLRDTP